jgi:hypothetical protein
VSCSGRGELGAWCGGVVVVVVAELYRLGEEGRRRCGLTAVS